MIRYISQHHGIGADHHMVADSYRPQDFCTRANIHMAAYLRGCARAARPDRYLLEDQTIGADFRIRVDNHTVGMGQQQATRNLRVDRNIRPGDHTPETMTKYRPLLQQQRQRVTRTAMLLVSTDARQQCP